MDMFLTDTVVLLAFVVLLGYFNEKVTKLTHEIALMLFSVIIGGALVVFGAALKGSGSLSQLLSGFQFFNLEDFLIEGVLCFMLFSGSCHMRLLDFKRSARAISLLAIGATFLGAVFYGLIFFAAGKVLGLQIGRAHV